MAANAGKSEAPTEHDSGIARVRERTIILGDTLIAIDNIGTIQILDVKRNWTMARWGIFAALLGVGAMMMPSNPYSSSGSPGPVLGMIFLALGAVMIIGNWLRPLRKGLAIGSSDGRLSYIVSENHAFLHRLLEVLTQKINTRNEGLTAVVDITNTTVNINGGAVAIGDWASATGVDNSINSAGGGLVIGANSVASGAGAQAAGHGGAITNGAMATPPTPPPPAPPPPAPPPPAPAAAAPIDPDEALFADDPAPAPPPSPAPIPAPPGPPRVVAAARTGPHDPLLDGSDAAPKEDDWLSSPGRVSYRPDREGGARWLLPLVLLLLVGGGGFAGWYFYTQSQTSTSISLMAPPEDAPATVTAAAAPADPTLAVAPAADTTLTLAETPALAVETPPFETPPAELAVSTPEAVSPATVGEITSFSPPETIVARASGLRYRTSPSAAENVQIIAETRAGGEALLVNGRVTQADGEWYRVAMPDGRTAWFKASLTVPRSRFAETFAIGPAQATSFAAAAPRILEPAEGAELPGGPQPVRLAWQGPATASIYIVEIETYDNITKRWIEDPPHKRVTVERMDELAESIPRTGAWRWRVRGVSPAGEQSQFSRWSAFGIRD